MKRKQQQKNGVTSEILLNKQTLKRFRMAVKVVSEIPICTLGILDI
jgi:hypothetical protein